MLSFIVISLSQAQWESEITANRAELLQGVKTIASPGIPGPVACLTPQAMPLVLAKDGEVTTPVVATSVSGTLSILAFGHPGYLEPGTWANTDTLRLFQNMVRRVGGDKTQVLVIGNQPLANHLRQNQVSVLENQSDFSAADVIIVSGHSDDPLLNRIGEWLTQRRTADKKAGLITAGLGWGWLQLNPGKTLSTHPGNRLLAPFGIAIGDGFLDSGKPIPTSLVPTVAHHAGLSISLVESFSPLNRRNALYTLKAALGASPEDSAFLGFIRERTGDSGAHLPKTNQPVGENNPIAMLVSGYTNRKLLANPTLPPAETDFPHLGVTVSELRNQVSAKPVSVRVTATRWESTGAYAAPGIPVDVTVPSGETGLFLRIGAHTDTLWHLREWRRLPEISIRVPLSPGHQTVTSPFGGLIYLESSGAKATTQTVTLRQTVPAPRFVLEETTLAQWKTIRNLPGPWAELESDKLILTVPSRIVRSLENPHEVMAFWDRVMDSQADLAGWSRTRKSPERMVPDVQISAGYMHAGYPIMTHLDVEPDFVQMDKLRKGNWGFFHELGHNHQSDDWTFDGTVEVTVNLFTLYTYDTVIGSRPKDRLFDPGQCLSYFRKHVEQNAKSFEKWKQDPFLALAMYGQLQNAFGWDAYKKVFREYLGLPASERPRTEAQKRDQWMIRFSRAVGRNLGPFFDAWGVPVSPEAKAQVASLPSWMPDRM
ncbi:MAG: M60 family metallopeptidase [Fimbriimonadaceae bacterium]|jgi:hypothetical protein|nr:M60 family metallopeptidase [Fimbriimonadaceae bacterium]